MARDEETSEEEQNVYGDEGREHLMDDGEISAEEDAFMQGYDQADHEDDESTHEAYEQAFESKRPSRKRSKKTDFEEEELEEL